MRRIGGWLLVPALLLWLSGCGTTAEQQARMQFCAEQRESDMRHATEMERVAYDANLENGARYFGGDRLVNKLRGWFVRDATLLKEKAANRYNACLETGVYE